MRTTRTERRPALVRAAAPAAPVEREDYWRRMQELRSELERLRAG